MDVVLAITVHAPGSQYQSTRSIFNDDYVTVGYIRVDNQGNFVAPNVHYLQTGIQCTGIVWATARRTVNKSPLTIHTLQGKTCPCLLVPT